MSKLVRVVLLAAVCLAGAGTAWAQAQATTGVIEGTITDPSGAAVPGASVTARNAGTGLERSTTTDDRGFYRVILLPLGRYTVTVRAQGFAELTRENLELTVGQTLTVNVSMRVGGVQEKITVTDETAVVETARIEQASLVDRRSVENLPINGRNFIDFVRLTPNVAISQGPDGTEININGQRGIYNNVMIDGADANNPFFGEQRGGQRPKYIVSLEAVKEFQVIADGASAEFGRSAGGFVNMVTKSGTNDVHGSAFYFFRGGGLLADNFDGTRDRDFGQHQFGGSVGGPLAQDRAFFFFSYDENVEDRIKDRAVFFGDPAFGGDPVDAVTCATIPGIPCGGSVTGGTTLVSYLASRFGNTTDGTTAGVASDMPQTNDARVLLAKGDFHLNRNNVLTTRYSYSRAEQLNGTFDVRTWLQSANGLEKDSSHSLVVSLASVITPTLLNEFRFQYAREPRPRPYPYENSVTGVTNPFGALPDTAIANFPGGADRSFRFGMPFFLPIPFATDDRWQFQDNFSIIRGRHSIKMGFDYNRTNMTQTFIGFANGRYIFGSVADFINYVEQGPAMASGGVLLYLQRVPLGGRTIEESGTQSLPVHEPAFFVQDRWQVRPNLTLSFGLRWEAQLEPGPLTPPSGTPYAQFFSDPRFPTTSGEIPDETAAWQPRFGFAWDPGSDGKTVIRGTAGIFYARTPSLVLAQPRISNGVINANLVAGNFFPGPLPDYGTLSTSTALFAPSVTVYDDDFRNPRSVQWSISAEREVAPNFSLAVAFNYANSVHLTRFINSNYPEQTGTDADGRPLYTGGARPFAPALGDVTNTDSSARSLYRALTLTATKKFSQRWQMQVNYVLSWDYSDDDNERDPFSFRYADANNLLPEYSFSDRDQRHRFNLYSTFVLPWDFNLAVILQARSAQPTSGSDLLAFDANGDGNLNDRRFVNGMDVGRNQQRKDNEFATFDFRVSRIFRWSERYELEPILEVFNLFNTENIIQSESSNLLFNFDGTIRSGLGDPRQAQLGVRFRF